ncbi:MAG TPA: hypothetical protein VGC30_07700, partial [Dokdonella sp.]
TIGFKGRMGLGYGIATAGHGTPTLYAVDRGVDAASPYAYLYSPATDDAGRIAVKVSTSDYDHNEIRLFSADGSSTRIAADAATDPASPFAAFDNGLALNDRGAIAVALRLVAGNVRALYRFAPDGAGGVAATEIARVDAGGTIRDIESFAPALADDGFVVFRAKDANGQAIYAGDGATLLRIVGKGDVVDTDRGRAQIGQHVDDPSAWPIFSGAPAVNAHGDVAFVAALYPEGDPQTEWGTGVFVAYAERAPDDTIFEDGFESAATAPTGRD